VRRDAIHDVAATNAIDANLYDKAHTKYHPYGFLMLRAGSCNRLFIPAVISCVSHYHIARDYVSAGAINLYLYPYQLCWRQGAP
jgi:hypothetical protein